MSEFEAIVEIGDYALVRISGRKKPLIYTAKRSNQDRWMRGAIREDVFQELIELYKEKVAVE